MNVQCQPKSLSSRSCACVCAGVKYYTYRKWYVRAQGSESAYDQSSCSSPVTRDVNDAAFDVRADCWVPCRRRDPLLDRGRFDALLVVLLFATSLAALATVSYDGLSPCAASWH
jgi:hypothetical protein